MKRMISLILTLAFLLCFASCAVKPEETTAKSPDSENTLGKTVVTVGGVEPYSEILFTDAIGREGGGSADGRMMFCDDVAEFFPEIADQIPTIDLTENTSVSVTANGAKVSPIESFAVYDEDYTKIVTVGSLSELLSDPRFVGKRLIVHFDVTTTYHSLPDGKQTHSARAYFIRIDNRSDTDSVGVFVSDGFDGKSEIYTATFALIKKGFYPEQSILQRLGFAGALPELADRIPTVSLSCESQLFMQFGEDSVIPPQEILYGIYDRNGKLLSETTDFSKVCETVCGLYDTRYVYFRVEVKHPDGTRRIVACIFSIAPSRSIDIKMRSPWAIVPFDQNELEPLNADRVRSNIARHAPIYRCDSLEDFEAFFGDRSPASVFGEDADRFDSEFFAGRSLLIVMATTLATRNCFVRDVLSDGITVTVVIEYKPVKNTLGNDQIVTMPVAIPVSKGDIASIKNFDAITNGTIFG